MLISSRLRTCYEEQSDTHLTQIALWQAYNQAFDPQTTGRPLMVAKDFIQNVQNTFPGAKPHVIPENGGQKYIIMNIRPRTIPVDPRTGRADTKCRWRTQPAMDDTECDEFFRQPQDLWKHIMQTHLGIMTDSETNKPKIDPEGVSYVCHWGNCDKFERDGETTSPWVISRHIGTHLPDASSKASLRQKANRDGEDAKPLLKAEKRWLNTQEDEQSRAANKREPAGLPLTSVLVLRNLARQLAKLDARSDAGVAQEMRMTMGGGGGQVEREGLVARVFAPVREQLGFVLAYNSVLVEYTASLMKAISLGGG